MQSDNYKNLLEELHKELDKCICFIGEIGENEDCQKLKDIRLTYNFQPYKNDENIKYFSNNVENTEKYLILISSLHKCENVSIELEKYNDQKIFEEMQKKYDSIYLMARHSDEEPPEVIDYEDRREKIFFEEFEGSVCRYYNLLSQHNAEILKDKIFKKDFSIENFILIIEQKLNDYLKDNKDSELLNLKLFSYNISKMDGGEENILYSSCENLDAKVNFLYFLVNTSRNYGLYMKQKGSNIILLGDENSSIFHKSNIQCDMVYPPSEISSYISQRYPRYIIRCFFK
jgi:hypothetical protein